MWPPRWMKYAVIADRIQQYQGVDKTLAAGTLQEIAQLKTVLTTAFLQSKGATLVNGTSVIHTLIAS